MLFIGFTSFFADKQLDKADVLCMCLDRPSLYKLTKAGLILNVAHCDYLALSIKAVP